MDKYTAFGAGYALGSSGDAGSNGDGGCGCLTFIWVITFPIWGTLFFLFLLIGPYGAMVTHNNTDSFFLAFLAFFGSYIIALFVVAIIIQLVTWPFKLFWKWWKQ